VGEGPGYICNYVCMWNVLLLQAKDIGGWRERYGRSRLREDVGVANQQPNFSDTNVLSFI